MQITSPDGSEVTSIEGLSYVTINGISGFDVTEARGLKTIAKDYEIEATSSEPKIDEWELTIVLVNLETNQKENINKTLQAEIKLQKEEFTIDKTNKAYHEYCYLEEGSMACEIAQSIASDETILYHDENLANGANDKSYRYSGASNLVNNYICFGSNEATCPEENLYRIIGVFDEKVLDETRESKYHVKLIKNTSIGEYRWSGSSSASSENVWANSTFNTGTLNGTYLEGLGEEWTSKIVNHKWKVGGMSLNESATAKQYYETEVGASSSSTTYEAKVGLMYVSDYGYGASQANWTTALYNYNNNTNTSNNWLYSGMEEWLISRTSGGHTYVFRVKSNGKVDNYLSYVEFRAEARLAFYLESNVVLSSGDGTLQNPYRIA